ncbi:molybdopterin converting factor subunit 1 [Tepidibacillus infernus]|uniref:Molybdopterin synthase catalytic subunit n=1 Tax=Tepidibacillus decaturensis TaxID=1413211 RepID=A0A135L4K9_9BACI|nr:molybdopterin converting factor subunit 1 [Tepidibacillus decaturensis]KXG43837.1 molybdopterin converting factor [Tepidibacillus decaturensis]
MQIKIKFFAGIAEATRKREHTLHLDHTPTVKDLIHLLTNEFPIAAEMIKRSMVSINHDYAKPDQNITETDEIALIPPVSGGEEPLFEVTTEPLYADQLIAKVSNPMAGAILTFVGTVREFTYGKRTTYLEYEAYPEMAIKKMEEIAKEIKEKWPNTKVAMSHRIGKLAIEEISVIIAVATPHRDAGFEAGRYAIERLKQIVPVWKKEIWENGEEWIGHQEGPWKKDE